jgi:hypothetical protein
MKPKGMKLSRGYGYGYGWWYADVDLSDLKRLN